MTDQLNHKKQFPSTTKVIRTTTALHAEQTSALVYVVISKLGGGGLKVAVTKHSKDFSLSMSLRYPCREA